MVTQLSKSDEMATTWSHMYLGNIGRRTASRRRDGREERRGDEDLHQEVADEAVCSG